MPDRLPDLSQDESLDDLILGGLQLIQPLSGYRFSIDAILLAHFPELQSGMQIFDLGTGSGVIALLLAYRHSEVYITGLEIQKQMVDRADRSVHINDLNQRITIQQADINQIPVSWTAAQADLVVCNPPFWKKGQGKINHHPEQALARHELEVNLEAVIKAGHHLLKADGRLAMILPAQRLAESLQEIARLGFCPTRLRMVHPTREREAGHFLIEATKATGRALTILPPLFIYSSAGLYSTEISRLYNLPPGEDV